MDQDLVRQFLVQIRKAFMYAKPKPVFKVQVDRMGQFKVIGTDRIEFYDIPEISDPVISSHQLLSKKLQKQINCALNRYPAVITGHSDVGVGRFVVAKDYKWRVEILKIRDMVMNDMGAIQIQAYECKGDRV